MRPPIRRNSSMRNVAWASILLGVLLVFIAAPLASAQGAYPATRLDWETGELTDVAQGFSHAETVGNQFSFDNTIARTGEQSLRVVVRPEDDPIQSGAVTERAELASLPTGVRSGTDAYYSWSTRFANDWQTPRDWGIIWQTHSPMNVNGTPWPTYSPYVAVDVRSHFRLSIDAGPAVSLENSGPTVRHRVMSDIPIQPDLWYDLILYVKWSPTNDGEATLWIRTENEADFTKAASVLHTPTMISYQGNVGENGYVKHGLYRNASPFTNTLWHDNFGVSSTFQEAADTWKSLTTPVTKPTPVSNPTQAPLPKFTSESAHPPTAPPSTTPPQAATVPATLPVISTATPQSAPSAHAATTSKAANDASQPSHSSSRDATSVSELARTGSSSSFFAYLGLLLIALGIELRLGVALVSCLRR